MGIGTTPHPPKLTNTINNPIKIKNRQNMYENKKQNTVKPVLRGHMWDREKMDL
jgi:conjugal transfer/entry exclusion protein